jgi:hypothetical protein
VAESSDEIEFAGQRWRWTMTVSQTQVDSLRRMDVSVRRSDAPEDSSLATLTGFYGTAIGAAGGGSLPWSGMQAGGAGDGGGDDDDDQNPPPEQPPAAPEQPPDEEEAEE